MLINKRFKIKREAIKTLLFRLLGFSLEWMNESSCMFFDFNLLESFSVLKKRGKEILF